jgi:hypothetical protein
MVIKIVKKSFIEKSHSVPVKPVHLAELMLTSVKTDFSLIHIENRNISWNIDKVYNIPQLQLIKEFLYL